MLVFGLSPDAKSREFLKGFGDVQIFVSGTVVKDVTIADGKMTFPLGNVMVFDDGSLGSDSDVSRNESGVSLSGEMYVSLGSENQPKIQRSDRLEFFGKVSDGFGTYIGYLKNPTLKRIDRPMPGDIFLSIRDNFSERIKENLSDDAKGLALGYLLGNRSEIDKSLEEMIKIVGLTHIIVASGAHLGVLTGFAKKIFGKISRFGGMLGALLFTAIFIGITGLSPSMARAGLVAFLSLFTWYFGLDLKPGRMLLYAMTITLMVNPSYPLNLGWLLSFAAFFGIMVVSPLLEKYFYGEELQKKTHFFGRLVITSISTLLMTAPILLFFYGKISLISIFANVLISPTIALAMGLTFLTGFSSLLGGFLTGVFGSGFLASLFGFLASSFGFLTDQIIHYHIFVVQSLAEIKFFLIEIKPQNPLVFLLYIPVLVMLGLVWRRTTRSRGRGGLSRSTR